MSRLLTCAMSVEAHSSASAALRTCAAFRPKAQRAFACSPRICRACRRKASRGTSSRSICSIAPMSAAAWRPPRRVPARMRNVAVWQFLNFLRDHSPVGFGMPIQRALDRVRQLVLLAEERDLRQVPAPALHMDAVRLMTVHGSKGLEFEAVHVPGLTQAQLSPLLPRTTLPAAGRAHLRRGRHVGLGRSQTLAQHGGRMSILRGDVARAHVFAFLSAALSAEWQQALAFQAAGQGLVAASCTRRRPRRPCRCRPTRRGPAHQNHISRPTGSSPIGGLSFTRNVRAASSIRTCSASAARARRPLSHARMTAFTN